MVHRAGVIRGVADPPAGRDALLAPVCCLGQVVPDMDSETGNGRLAVGGGKHHLVGDDRASAEGEAGGRMLQGRLPRILVLLCSLSSNNSVSIILANSAVAVV